MKKEKVLVFSIALGGYAELFGNCIKSQKSYCKRYDFQYISVKNSPIKLPPSEAAWLKLFLLRSALLKNFEWVSFLDADCFVRSHAPSFVEKFKNFDKPKSIFMAQGFSGRINSGVIFIRNTPEALAYLDEVIENKDNPVPKEDQAPFENGHMIKYGKNNPSVKIIDNRLWNNNIELDHGSYIQHYSGGKLRPLYLKKHPLASSIYRLKKKWKFSSRQNKRKNSVELESIIPWFKKNYSEFNNNKK